MFKKFKSKRGMTLVEVLTVVALLAIMLGIAVPNLLAESQEIELATMNGYARSVAVAVQSRLYGMRYAGTSVTSYYRYFKDEATCDVTITTAEGNKTVQYVSNFGEKGTEGKQYLFSRALTDTELMQNGKIVVVYDPETANVLETFYSENDFDIASLFPTVSDDYLKSNLIGVYLGEGAPAPATQTSLPMPSVIMENGEELVAKITIPKVTDVRLLDQEVALEIYISDGEGTQAMIYGEGFYAAKYRPAWLSQTCLFELDIDKPFKLGDIQGKTLKFAVDSIVLTGVPWTLVEQQIMFFTSGASVLCGESSLFPRASLLTQWLNVYGNPHYNAWLERSEVTLEDYYAGSLLGQKLNVGDYIEFEVVLHALTGDVSSEGRYREFYDDDEEKFQAKLDEGIDLRAVSSGATEVNGFFESAVTRADGKIEAGISCVRHLQNLCFDGSMGTYYGVTNKPWYCAKLMKDISGGTDSPWYKLLSNIRKDLIAEWQKKGIDISELYPEDRICSGGALRRLGGIEGFEFDGGGHTISDLYINAKVWKQGDSNFESFYGEPDEFAKFFQPVREYEDAKDAAQTYEEYMEYENKRQEYYQANKDWFSKHPSDCLATFSLKNCTLRNIQDDQTGYYYINGSYTYPS